MTTKQAALIPPNSLLLIMDYSIGEPPEAIGDDLVAFTDTCVAIGTMSGIDGETTVVITDEPGNLCESDLVVFDGSLKTGGRNLSVCNTKDEIVLSFQIASPIIRLKIRVNDLTEPSRITLQIM